MASGTLVDYNAAGSSTIATYNFDFNSVGVAYSVNTDATPYANGGEVSEVQNQTFSNPVYTLQGVLITERSGSITYDKLREFATRKYDPTDKYLLLKIDYGVDSSTLLPDSAGGTTGIKVVIKSFNANITTDRYADTDKQVGTASIVFLETA